MSSHPGYVDSDDESYPGCELSDNPYSRYPIHDACQFLDVEYLRKVIIVPKSPNSDEEDSGDNCIDEDQGGIEDRSSDDSSGTDGENDTAAAAAAAMGHQPPTIAPSSSKLAKVINQSISYADKSLLKSTAVCAKERGSEGSKESTSQKLKTLHESLYTIPTSNVNVNANVNVNVNGQSLDLDSNSTSPAQILKGAASLKDAASFSGMDISPVEFHLAVRPDMHMPQDDKDVAGTPQLDGNALKVSPTPLRETSEATAGDTGGNKPYSLLMKLKPPNDEIIVNEKKSPSSDKIPQKKLDKSQPLKELITYCPFDLNERDEDENTPLHVAIHHRKLDHIHLLLEAGASPNRKCDGSAPIQTIISIGAISAHKTFAFDAVMHLHKFNADLNVRDDSQQTPLYLAAACNLPSVIGIILNDPVGLQTLNMKSNRSAGRPLHAAAMFDTSKIAVGPMGAGRNGPPRNQLVANRRYGTASVGGATIAATGASSKALLTQILLSTPGIEVDPRNNYGRTPLHIACSRGNWPVSRLLLEAGADPILRDQRGFTPGAIAYKRGMSIPNDLITTLGSPGTGVPPSLEGCMPPLRDLIIDPEGRTLLICHELCSQHMTCPPITRDGLADDEPPPENVRRLAVLLNEEVGILRSAEFDACRWEGECRRAAMADILKVHEYNYIEKISQICAQLPDIPKAIANLDADTAVSRWSFEAAMRASGSVCAAVDRVMSGDFRNAFCAVRPPGHHAGPRGIVRCPNDPEGSHGFCLLNNVAIGAAYARSMYRNDGIQKVAIIDFDVHHGNGTEEIIRQLMPDVERASVRMPFASGQFETSHYRPWLDETDIQNVFFASTHGYGPRDLRFADHLQPHQGGWFYPASGKTITTDAILTPSDVETPDLTEFLFSQTWTRMGDESRLNCCKVINIGLDLPKPNDVPGMQRVELRDSYRKNILPHLIEFDPDIIFISAGFDGHKRDSMNFGYVGMVEEDYEWVTEQLVKVANKCCNGRIVSVLEGGYKIHGGIVSPFARSVASHVRALVEGGNSRELYDKEEAEWEGTFEREIVEEREKRRLFRMEQVSRPIATASGDKRRNFASLPSRNGGENAISVEAIDTEAILKEPLSQYTVEDINCDSQTKTAPDDKDAPTRKRRRNHVDYKQLLEKLTNQDQRMITD